MAEPTHPVEIMNAAPVAHWDPPFCGDMDLVIRRDGVWLHEGSPIGRPELVRLFAKILKKEGDEHFLVNPVEKLRIRVEDTPFRIIRADRHGDDIWCETDVGDVFPLNADHALTVTAYAGGTPHPLVHVRGGLMARIERAVFYELVREAKPSHDGHRLILASGDQSFDLGPTE